MMFFSRPIPLNPFWNIGAYSSVSYLTVAMSLINDNTCCWTGHVTVGSGGGILKTTVDYQNPVYTPGANYLILQNLWDAYGNNVIWVSRGLMVAQSLLVKIYG